MAEYLYRLEHGSYYLTHAKLPWPTSIRSMSDQVALAYARGDDGFVLMKHGSPEVVRGWLEHAIGQYKRAGLDEMAEALEMVELPRGFDVDEINKCLTTSGYIGTLVKRIEAEFP